MKLIIEELESAPNKEMEINFNSIIKDINPNKEVEANLIAISEGACIEISGTIKAVVKLECNRCLKEFEQPINIEIHEVFTKDEVFDYSVNEIELKNDNFVVELNGDETIDIEDLIYQSVVVNTPNERVCDQACEGLEELKKLKKEITDPRLAVFKDISKKIN